MNRATIPPDDWKPTPQWNAHEGTNGEWIAASGIETIVFDSGDAATNEAAARRYATMAERQSPMAEYDAKIRANMIEPARKIIIGMTETDLLSLTNGIPQLVAATAPGEFVGDSTLTKERAEAISDVATAFRTFLATPMANGKTPLVVLMERD